MTHGRAQPGHTTTTERRILRQDSRALQLGVRFINNCRDKLGMSAASIDEFDRLTMGEMCALMNEWRMRVDAKEAAELGDELDSIMSSWRRDEEVAA